MKGTEPGMGMEYGGEELNKDEFCEENVEEDDLWRLLKNEDDTFEDGGLPVLTENVVQGRPVKRDSSAHGAGHVGDQPGGLDDKNHPDPSPATSSTMAVSSQAVDATLATTDHRTLPGI